MKHVNFKSISGTNTSSCACIFCHVVRYIFGHVAQNIFGVEKISGLVISCTMQCSALRASLLVNSLHLLKNVPEHLVLAETLRKYTSPPECMAATICPVILW